MADRKSLLVAAVSTVAGLLACEMGLRVLIPRGGGPVLALAPAARSASLKIVSAVAARLDAAPGTSRQWFLEDPEPLPRAPVDPAALARYQDFDRRGLYPSAAQYVFNRLWVEGRGCKPNEYFYAYPATVLAFDPPGRTQFPRARFPANATLPDGLVTNQRGLRGPQIAIEKPPRVIRVAFVGASTTVNEHGFHFSYPEYTVHFLNRFAEANRLEVRFEVLNAGREGLGSSDIAAVVRDELVPLGPDLVVYYEGANQFHPHELTVPRMHKRDALDPKDTVGLHKVPEWFRAHSAIGDLIDRALSGFVSAGEPAKPLYALLWPFGVDQNHPDPDNQNLKLELPIIVRDLDDMRAALRPSGGQLVLASFVRLAGAGMRLSPVAHKYIYRELNTEMWPLRYADIRRISDYQNRVFRDYAESRRIPFLDIAAQVPQDPSLFTDTVHMTESGERLKAWIAFQQLVPLIRSRIESGRLPQTARPPLPPAPSMTPFEMPVCPAP